MMVNLTNLTFVAAQLSSLIDYIDKSAKDGYISQDELERMDAVCRTLVDCTRLLNGDKLIEARQEFLGKLEKLVSKTSYNEIYQRLDRLKAEPYVSEERLNQITGQKGIYEKIDAQKARDCIGEIYGVLKAKIDGTSNGTNGVDITDYSLNSISTVCEVTHLLINQYAAELKDKK